MRVRALLLTFSRLHQGVEVVFLTDRHEWLGSEHRVFGVVGRVSWPAPEESDFNSPALGEDNMGHIERGWIVIFEK